MASTRSYWGSVSSGDGLRQKKRSSEGQESLSGSRRRRLSVRPMFVVECGSAVEGLSVLDCSLKVFASHCK